MDYEKLYNELVNSCLHVAFDERNIDTELLLRCLLRQNQITLEDGMYTRKDFNYENKMHILGELKSREKDFYIQDDCLDEYTKQLERQLIEYTQAKELFKKYNFKNETMIDAIKRMANKIDELEDTVDSLYEKIDAMQD